LARYNDAVCKLCRREGEKLFLKGERCLSDKCAVEKRNYPPGEHGRRRRVKQSEYGIHLREKQKLRRTYGLLERQFSNYFELADKKKGITGENLLMMLEMRLDSVVQRLGFASSKSSARQIVRHGHITVNDRKVNIPSYQVKPGQVVAVKEKSKKLETIKNSLEAVEHRGIPQWLDLDKDNMKGTVMDVPTREDITLPINEQLIVEYYSR
jgi:small subunit ribosomal protein S4